MNKKQISAFVLSGLLFSQVAVTLAQEISVKDIKKYVVEMDKSLYVPYDGETKGFEDGFVTGFGSAITFKGLDKDGNPEFWGLTDRGPNADAPSVKLSEDETLTSKIFPSPKFTPSIGLISMKDDKATVLETISLKDKDGKEISGLPVSPDSVGFSGEVALSESMEDLGNDDNGKDTEGIAVDKDGNFWISDEYGPFITQFDKDGKELLRLAPGEGLPEIIADRIPNRGFEGLTITPSGNIVATVQSVLDIDGETAKTALFTRVVEYNPETKETKMYAYPVVKDDYEKVKDCKIGDIYAISDTRFLMIEQGKDAKGEMQNRIFTFDISDATDLTNQTVDEKELEFVDNLEDLKDFKFGTKELLVDLRAEGWTAEKAEGLVLFNDNKSLAIINDNDFGIKTVTEDPDNEGADITDYLYDFEKKTYSLEDKEAKPSISIAANEDKSELWILEFADALK